MFRIQRSLFDLRVFSLCFLFLTACSQPPPEPEEPQEPETVVVSVKGMTCENCVKSINGAMAELPGMIESSVSLEEDTATLIHDPAQLTAEEIAARIQRLGYETRLPEDEPEPGS